MNREYRGHQIVRHDNAQTGCPGNSRMGASQYYEIWRGGQYLGSWVQLSEAKACVDHMLDVTDEDRAKVDQLRASLLGEGRN